VLIAHRGASCDAPENTLASVNLAWQRNVDAVEVDLRLSKDGCAVVIHDDTTKRTGGKNAKVKEQTLQELKRLDVGRHKGGQWSDQRIPTFEEVLRTVPEDRLLFVDIKCGPEIFPELDADIGRSHVRPEQVVLMSFELDTAAAAKRRHPEICILWICDPAGSRRGGGRGSAAKRILAAARQAGLDGLNVKARRTVDAAFVGQLKAAEMKVFVWTVNRLAAARRFRELEVDGIVTDRPGWLGDRLEPAAKGGPQTR